MKRYHAIGIALSALVIAGAALSGCTDATQSQIGSYGSPHHIKCDSFGYISYEGTSTGRVKEDGDTIAFEAADTRKLVEIKRGQTATCVIKVI